jgi:hypothetical protein
MHLLSGVTAAYESGVVALLTLSELEPDSCGPYPYLYKEG